MAHQTQAPEGHWSHYVTTDTVAECYSYFPSGKFGVFTEAKTELYGLLWNEIGPGLTLADHWGQLTEAQQVELDRADAAY